MPLMENIFIADDEVERRMNEVEQLFDRGIDPNKRRILQNHFWRLYRTDWTRNMVRQEWKEKGQLDFNLCALKLNNETILSTRGEIFSQLGADMVDSYDSTVILTTIANEYVSYFLPDFERKRGGYTASVAVNQYGTTDSLIQSAQNLLYKIYQD